jgi:alkanesulfonate monooxygenase SsuD/methylene tetrahydromethanopterin reductase-like flavin-dependent oxidoreductase (luciferase family)
VLARRSRSSYFAGRFDRVDRAALVPKPTRPIPIWLGGSSEKAYDRAARLGDGFMFMGGEVDKSVVVWTRLRQRVADLDRPVEDFGGDFVSRSGGDVDRLTGEIEAWGGAGGTHVSVITMGLGLNSVDAHIDRLTALAGELSLS